ncbi:TetR/AcrR family transcriptional regulator [Mycobacterium sp. C31M]
MAGRRRNARGEGALLRDELLAGAQRILERTGNEDDVTLRAVAREVGISAPSIYAHFADGQAIVDALVQQTFAELTELLEKARDEAPTEDRLFAVCLAYIRFGLDQPERYLTLFERRRSLERARQLVDTGHDFATTKGAAAFAILVDELPGSEATFERATLLWTGMHGYVTLRASSPLFPWFADDDTVCRELINRMAE